MRPLFLASMVHAAMMAFVVANSASAVAQQKGVPKPGDKRTKLAFRLSARVGSTGSDSDRKTYAPDAGWYIVDVKYKERSKFGIASQSFGYQRANSKFASVSEANEAYKEALDAAVKYGQSSYQGAIKQEMKTFQQYRNKVQATHGTIYGTAKVRGRGLTQGGSSVNVDYYVTEVYVGTKIGLRNRGSFWLKKIKGSTAGKSVTIRYSIFNDSKRTVRFRLPSGRTYSLKQGETGRYTNTSNGRPPTITVLNTGRTYTLKGGQHKFFWKASEKRIGLDLNYR